ncbi:hypothetical protein ACMGGR_03615 [Erwinia sp. BNK-24-b]|uniref:hypothetical protein n=1 Tax=unclassified Erwinia TaxID=2622719 RepID=UPI0039BEF136
MAVKQFTQTRPEFTNFSSLPAGMDFIDLAEYNERLVSALMETDNDMERLALFKKLTASFEKLRSIYQEPVPDNRIMQLTTGDVTTLRNTPFITEPETLTDYCQALTQVLMSGSVSGETQRELLCLLFELVNFQVDDLKAPRYIETYGGLVQVR